MSASSIWSACRAIKWREETLGAQFDIVDVPPEMVAEAKAFRAKLVEAAVEQDDAALEAYLGGEEPDEETLKRCIRKGTIGGAFVPVLCGSAFKNKGVQPLLDAVVDYLPAPTDVAAIKGVKMGSNEHGRAPLLGRRAVCRARLQDHERPVCRLADLCPHLFRGGDERQPGAEHASRTAASGSAACC